MSTLIILGLLGVAVLATRAGATRDPDPTAPATAAPADARAWSIDWVWPLPQSIRTSSPFGWRTSPFDASKSQFHPGIDLAAALGEPVYSAAQGVVVESYLSPSWGNRIVLEHDLGVRTTYNHMSDRLLGVGEAVGAGELIGWCGTTGMSTGPHLHFEVWVDGKAVDPLLYLDKDMG